VEKSQIDSMDIQANKANIWLLGIGSKLHLRSEKLY